MKAPREKRLMLCTGIGPEPPRVRVRLTRRTAGLQVGALGIALGPVVGVAFVLVEFEGHAIVRVRTKDLEVVVSV